MLSIAHLHAPQRTLSHPAHAYIGLSVASLTPSRACAWDILTSNGPFFTTTPRSHGNSPKTPSLLQVLLMNFTPFSPRRQRSDGALEAMSLGLKTPRRNRLAAVCLE